MSTHCLSFCRAFAVLCFAALAPSAWAQCKTLADTGCTDLTSPKWQGTMVHHQLEGHPRWPDVIALDGSVNTQIWPGLHYWVYVPPAAAQKKNPPLVIYIHGTQQNPEKAARGVRWNELADRRGFVVLYPMGESGDNWGWGSATVYGRGAAELEAVARITREVHQNYGTDPGRVFVSGTSSGAITATMLGALYADLYTAVGSFLGGSYSLADPTGLLAYQAMGDNAKVVPAFLAHGTLDHLFPPEQSRQADSQWVGTNDWADNGELDGSVSPLPEIDDTHRLTPPAPGGGSDVCARPENNPCIGPVLGYTTYPYEIHRYRDDSGAGRTVVESWYIHGLGHNYPFGDPEGNFIDPTGPDITTASYEFFERVIAAAAPTPSLIFSANRSTAQTGETVDLSWTATHLSNCAAGGDWSGAKSLSGSETVNVGDIAGTREYTLTCAAAHGQSVTRSNSVTVTATPPPPAPTIALSSDKSSAQPGEAILLTWSSSNATSCTASGDWSGTKTLSGSESVNVGTGAGSRNYSLSCTGAGGSSSAHAAVTVAAAPPGDPDDPPAQPPGVQILSSVARATVNETFSLAWTSSSGVSACVASGAWSGDKSPAGGESRAEASPGAKTYAITCNSASGPVGDEVTVTITAPGETPVAPAVPDSEPRSVGGGAMGGWLLAALWVLAGSRRLAARGPARTKRGSGFRRAA